MNVAGAVILIGAQRLHFAHLHHGKRHATKLKQSIPCLSQKLGCG
jgi:hypothetical protein